MLELHFHSWESSLQRAAGAPHATKGCSPPQMRIREDSSVGLVWYQILTASNISVEREHRSQNQAFGGIASLCQEKEERVNKRTGV